VGAQGTEVGAIFVAHLPGLTCPPWLGGEASQEQPRSVVEAPIISSQKSYLHSAGNTDGSRGGSDRCGTPTKADMSPAPHGYGKVTLQEQSRPGAVSYIRSSQKSDINSGGGASGNSGHNGGSHRRSPPTRADTPPMASRRNTARTAPTHRGTAYTLVPKQ
jgi:hypothetical protein